MIMVLVVLLVAGLLSPTATAQQSSCEQLDGNCPPCRLAGYNGTVNFNARFDISPDDDLGARAASAQTYMSSQGSIDRFDNPDTGLHTTLFYFCCHTQESAQGVLDAMQTIEWEPIDIHYESFGCNLGMHVTNRKTVYLHSMPADKGQAALFSLARKLIQAS